MESHFPSLSDAQGQLARDRVLTDLKTLARDVEDLLHSTAGDFSEQARAVRARVTAALERVQTSYQILQARGIESAKAAARKTNQTIRAHPYQSLAVALGIGVLVGALLRRK